MKKLITYTSILALIIVTGSESFAQYCTPRATQSNWTSMDQLQTSGAINNVNLSGLYLKYSDLTATAQMLVKPAQTVQFNLTARYDRVGTSYYPKVWIDMNSNNVFDFNELIYNGPRVSWNSANVTAQFNVLMPPLSRIVPAGPKRMRVNVYASTSTNPCVRTTGGSSVDFMVLFPPNSSTTIGDLVSPRNPICPGTLVQNLTVEVCNDGLGRVDSMLVGGVFNTTDATGNPLPAINIPNTWQKDSLMPGKCTQFSIYTHAPGFKTGDTLTLWSSMPNGVSDSMNIDDTVMFVITPTITKKLWTVGDTANGANDFSNLNLALDSFAAVGGICDTLIIELDSSHNGYIGQYDFPNLAGTSPTTPIILRGKASNGARAKLSFDSCDVDNNYIMHLTDMSYLYIENIDFYSQNGFTTDHSHNLLLDGGSEHIYIDNCSFRSDYANTNRDNTLILGDGTGDNISITSSEFIAGTDGIYIKGGSSHTVEDCDFTGSYLSSIHFESTSNIHISDNSIASLAPNISNTASIDLIGMGIFVFKCSGDLIIDNNIVKSSNSQWPRYGVYVEDYNKGSGTNWIYNNFLNIGQPWSSLEYRGITISNSNFTQVANNNIAINGNGGANEGVFYEQGTGNALWNNVIVIEVAGVAVNQASFGAVTKSDYNNFYAPGNDIVSIGGTGGGNFATLTAYQNATSLDMNSRQLNPFFYNTKGNDLHVCNNALSKAGTVLPGITDDYDGDPRSTTTPSIGADEFTPISDVKLAADYGLCPGDSTRLTAGRGNFGETAIWKSLATGADIDTNQWISINTPGEYSVTFFNACGVVVDTIEIITPDAVSLPNDTNMCFGTTLNVNTTIVGGTNYAWSSNDSTALVAITQQSTYSVTATDNWGCVSADTFNVTYSPAADFGRDSIIVCEGASQVVLSNVDGTIGATFTWTGYSGGATNRDPGAAISDFELPSPRAYVKVTVDHKGCISQDSILMKILGRPVIDIADTTNGLLFKVISNNSPGSNHSWDFGDGDSSNFRLPKHIYAKDGIYTVKYTNSNQCRSKDTTFEVSISTLNILENESGAALTLYPNPNNGKFNLDFKGLNGNDVSVSIVDINGRTVFNEAYGVLTGNNNKEVNLVNVAPGFYTIAVEVDGESYQDKFIVK